jgi:phage terminase small subunit
MGRNKKPTAQKKLEGTFRKDRDGKKPDNFLPSIIDTSTEIEVPQTITDDYVIDAFKAHARMLCQLQLLTPSDIPELEQLYLTLQQLRQVQSKLKDLDPITNMENYSALTKLSIKLGIRFSSLCAKYYISPQARMKLQLDALNVEKVKTENKSIAAKLLSAKKF